MKWFVLIAVLLLMLAGGAAAAGATWFLRIYNSAPAISELKPRKQSLVTKIYAADGSQLGVIHSETVREPVAGDLMSHWVKDGTIAIEDKNFYKEGGVDVQAIVRAGWRDAKAGGKPLQGASTITQQLVRNLYIADPSETIRRKIIEAHLANEESDANSKDTILTEYLNTAPYGTNAGATALGVQAAAETYFSRPAKRLTLPEAALIAGLPQAPSEYNPLLHPKAALTRRNDVLQAMLKQHYITATQYTSAVSHKLALHPSKRYTQIKQPYIFDYVQKELIQRYGADVVRNGGLKVYTTINPRLQKAAQSSVDACAVCNPNGGPASALASVDPKTGEIVALASSQHYSGDSQFNFAAQAHRQPGSSFKPFVLATAIKQGIDPSSTYYDGSAPLTLTLPGGSSWTVDNSEPGSGTMSLVDATVDSVNAVFAQLVLDVGVQQFADTAYSMGITSPLGVTAKGHAVQARRELLHPAGSLDRRAERGRHAARDGQRLRDARRRWHPPHPDHDRQGRLPRRPRRAAGKRFRPPRAHRGRGLRRHEGPRGRDHQRHRRRIHLDRLQLGGRQDRNHRRPVRRLVRRLHAALLDRGLDRASALTQLHRLRRPDLWTDLALVHEGRPGQRLP